LFFCRFGFRGPSIRSGGALFNSFSLDPEICFMNFIWASLRIARSTIALDPRLFDPLTAWDPFRSG
jgi:hypothetical protein